MASKSPLGEARPPKKPGNQGTAGSAKVSQPRKGGPMQGGNTMGGLKPFSIKKPGSGTNGSSKTSNSPSKT